MGESSFLPCQAWPGCSNLLNSHLLVFSNLPTFTLRDIHKSVYMCILLVCIVTHVAEVNLELISCCLFECFESIFKAFSTSDLKFSWFILFLFLSFSSAITLCSLRSDYPRWHLLMDGTEVALKVCFTSMHSCFVMAHTRNLSIRCAASSRYTHWVWMRVETMMEIVISITTEPKVPSTPAYQAFGVFNDSF